MRPNFEFQVLVLRALAFIIRQLVWSEQRAELDKDLTDGIKAIERERTHQEATSGFLDLL